MPTHTIYESESGGLRLTVDWRDDIKELTLYQDDPDSTQDAQCIIIDIKELDGIVEALRERGVEV